MGMYTEIVCGFSLRSDTPDEVITALKTMTREYEDHPEGWTPPEHELFKCERWTMVLSCASYYFGFSRSHKLLVWDEISNTWMLSARASLKNYDNEIEKFFDWIKPYVESGSGATNMIGYSMYEEASEPTLYYAEVADED